MDRSMAIVMALWHYGGDGIGREGKGDWQSCGNWL